MLNQTLISDLLAERDSKFPYFIGYDTVNKHIPTKDLGDRLFHSLSKQAGPAPAKFDLSTLKRLIIRSYQLCQFELLEIQATMRWTQDKYLISRKYFEIYQMVGNISIDGFKRERYVVKIKDISDELVRAYHALNEEEFKIEQQYAQQQEEHSMRRSQQYSLIEENKHSYSTEKEVLQYARDHEQSDTYLESIKYITSLLLKIETLEESKKSLLAKLVLKEKKWIENDKIFKERRFTLMSVLQYDLALVIDCSKHLLFIETVGQRRLALHEKYVLMINQVFERNRLKSAQFISDIKHIVRERQDQLVDLKLNFDELIIKDKQIEDGKTHNG